MRNRLKNWTFLLAALVAPTAVLAQQATRDGVWSSKCEVAIHQRYDIEEIDRYSGTVFQQHARVWHMLDAHLIGFFGDKKTYQIEVTIDKKKGQSSFMEGPREQVYCVVDEHEDVIGVENRLLVNR